jgi:polyhydroxyalkanoate synthesis regulator phasin
MSGRREERDSGQGGLGFLSTIREALDDVIAEAREKGEMSAERAREAVRGAMGRARDVAGDRLDLATRQELHELKDQIAELKVRLGNLERRSAQDPQTGPWRPEEAGPGME